MERREYNIGMARAPEPSLEKKRLRREMIARRDAMPAAERDRLALSMARHVTALAEYRSARTVLATMSIGSEFSTRHFIDRARADGKTIVLPRITEEKPKRLELHAVRDFAHDLVPGVWDIPEPDPARCRRVEITAVDFALVPALAVDRENYRLGYGAGFFDGLLGSHPVRPYCVTALPGVFVVDRLPHEAHDIPVDAVLGEEP
jgi:5,10-methenyltetrahydrofolate synthetase